MPSHSPRRLFLENLRNHWVAYSLGILSLLITSLSEVLLPKFIQWALDVATRPNEQSVLPAFLRGKDSHSTLDILILSLLGILVMGWMGRIAWRQILARQTHLAGHMIKTRIWSVLKDQPLSLLDRYSLGDLMNRATADWNKTRFIHGFTLVTTFDLIFFTVMSVTAMLMIHAPTALLCLIVIPFLPRRIIKISKQEYRLHEFAQEQLSLLSDLISQAVSTIRLQRATASESIWEEKLKAYAAEYAKRQFEVLKAGWKIFVLGALPTIAAYSVLFTYGITQIHSGELSIGGFVALQSYVLLLQTPLFEMGSNISEWQTGLASYKRIAEIYDLQQEPIKTPAEAAKDAKDSLIVVNKLSLRYETGRPILNNISINVKAGDRIGFMGPIGTGKTSLINSIAGLIEEYEGEVYLRGQPLHMCGRDWITDTIAMVPQKPFLFAGSIRHNLSPATQRTEDELIEVLRCVELWTDVQRFPEGLDSWIGEWGINLSGGQKQRLALARALLKPAPVLILDDCLSAVDSLTEARILENMGARLKDQALIWTAHRLSTLHLCERIYRMEGGQISQLSSQENLPSRSLSKSSSDLLAVEV